MEILLNILYAFVTLLAGFVLLGYWSLLSLYHDVVKAEQQKQKDAKIKKQMRKYIYEKTYSC